MTQLSVNVNKIAVLRNSRGGDQPSVVQAADAALRAGAGGITVHPRPDQRHIRADDVFALADVVRGRGEYNLEGNPFAPAQAGYPGFLALVEATRPTQATLVPDGDGQITSDHGFDLDADAARLAPIIGQLKAWGVRVSVFMDAGHPSLARAATLAVDRIELYTGPYAHAAALGNASAELQRCADSARRAQSQGVGVNAGHDLSQTNLAAFLATVPGVLEVSIGHALIGEALYEGLDATVRAYLRIIQKAGSTVV